MDNRGFLSVNATMHVAPQFAGGSGVRMAVRHDPHPRLEAQWARACARASQRRVKYTSKYIYQKGENKVKR
jgi:hypothetical protein